jgi:hypothetical protein
MKIAILVIAALVGFWVVGAILERFQTKTANPDASSRSGTGPRPAPKNETRQVDPIEEACRVLQLNRPFTTDELRAAYRQRMSQYHPTRSIAWARSSVSSLRASRRKSIERSTY